MHTHKMQDALIDNKARYLKNEGQMGFGQY